MFIFFENVNTIKAKSFILPLGGLKWKSKEVRNNKNSKNNKNNRSRRSKDKNKNKKDKMFFQKNHRDFNNLKPYGFTLWLKLL